jgi:hypothetical protein
MDILSQYNKERSDALGDQTWSPSAEYGFLIRLVMRLSGGRIQDARKVTVVLVAATLTGLAASVAVLAIGFYGGDSGSNIDLGVEIDQRQFTNP